MATAHIVLCAFTDVLNADGACVHFMYSSMSMLLCLTNRPLFGWYLENRPGAKYIEKYLSKVQAHQTNT